MKATFKLTWIAIAAAVPAMSSCGSSGEDIDEKFEAYPVKVESSENWSLVDKDGKFLYEDEFENQPSAVVEGHFAVKEANGYTLYKADSKKPVAVKGCEELVSVGMMSDGLIPVTKKDSRISVVNKSGEQVFELTPYNKHEIVEASIYFTDGFLGIKTDEGKYGYVDTKGNVVIKPIYEDAMPFNEGLALVSKDEDKNYMVIDKKGETVFKFKKSWTPQSYMFGEGGALIVKDENDRILLVDKKGEAVKMPAKVNRIGELGKDYFTFSEDGNWGVMKREDQEVVIRAKYESIVLLPDNRFLCRSEKGQSDILTADGEKVLSIDDYERGVGYIPFFGLIGAEKNSIVILDAEGKPVKNAEYSDLGSGYITYSVVSDYLDLEPVMKIIQDVTNPKGFGKFKYGATPQSILEGSASDYSYKTTAELPDASGEGYKYSYSTKAQFKNTIASYNYDYYSYSGRYSWTSDNSLTGFELNIKVQKELSESAFNKFIDTLKSAGYKLGASKFADDSGTAVLRNGKVAVLLQMEKSYNGENISVSTTDSFDDYEYDSFVSTINGTEKPDRSEYAQAADSVAVDLDAVEVLEPDYYY